MAKEHYIKWTIPIDDKENHNFCCKMFDVTILLYFNMNKITIHTNISLNCNQR